MNSCFRNKWFAASAALSAALGLVACDQPSGSPETGSAALCQAETKPVTEIQGSQYQSPIEGQVVTALGVVTRVEAGSGVYIEDTRKAHQRNQSRALFLADAILAANLAVGQIASASGRIAELGNARDTLTSLTEITEWGNCGESTELPLTAVKLPLRSKRREALEGMRVGFDAGLTVTDIYRLNDGQVRLSHEGPLRVPTDIVRPGRSSARQFSRNLENSVTVALSGTPASLVAAGATGSAFEGVLGHDGRYPLLHAERLDFNLAESPPAPAHPGGNVLRVVNANLENFFNGAGDGSGFPAERGPESHAEFLEKSVRIEAAIQQLQPDLLTVQEVENDGFESRSAASDLLQILKRATGYDWNVVKTESGRVGDDVIAVGIFYRPDRLEAVGPAHVLDGPEFRGLSRHPLAQLFRDSASGRPFWVSVNHLKSKGRCPDDGPDSSQKDGQGCWNQARVAAVEALVPWLQNLAGESGVSDVLITGDMNAWRQEDPTRAFLSYDLIDLVQNQGGRDSYSYIYRGERGTIDYGFASSSLSAFVRNAQTWNINAAWPRDRSDLSPPWLRYSDHDPVVIDFDFSQSSTSR